jgi:hypothetical protein
MIVRGVSWDEREQKLRVVEWPERFLWFFKRLPDMVVVMELGRFSTHLFVEVTE